MFHIPRHSVLRFSCLGLDPRNCDHEASELFAGWTKKSSTFMFSQLGLCCCLRKVLSSNTLLFCRRYVAQSEEPRKNSFKWRKEEETKLGKGFE